MDSSPKRSLPKKRVITCCHFHYCSDASANRACSCTRAGTYVFASGIWLKLLMQLLSCVSKVNIRIVGHSPPVLPLPHGRVSCDRLSTNRRLPIQGIGLPGPLALSSHSWNSELPLEQPRCAGPTTFQPHTLPAACPEFPCWNSGFFFSSQGCAGQTFFNRTHCH